MHNDEEKKLKQLIAQTLGINGNFITDDLSYQDIPEWDSLRHVNLMLALEKNYACEINEEAVLNLATIKKIKEFILNNIGIAAKSIELSEKQIHRGLRDVFYDKTEISLINGEKGKLSYCGYDITDLCKYSTFEECTYLLLYKKLPTREELTTFEKILISKRKLNLAFIDFIASMEAMHPTEMLRTMISAFPNFYKKDSNALYETDIALELIAKIPTIITTHNAIRNKTKILEPEDNLTHAQNFIYMLTGKIPSVEESRVVDQDLILHAEHGSNASTFTARIVTGAEGDIFAAITAAISAFSGRLHGGALEEVMLMLKEINTPQRAVSYVTERIMAGKPIFGYGHSVYRKADPRALEMQEIAKKLSIEKKNIRWLEILENISSAMKQHTKYGVNVNVDFYAAVIYELLAIPQDMFVAVFIMSRISGWIAHIHEQKKNNILIRPSLKYTGLNDWLYIDINHRYN